MAVYTISPLNPDRTSSLEQSFVCADDGEAMTLARQMMKADACAEVRLGTRLVGRVMAPARGTMLDIFIAQSAAGVAVLKATATNDNEAGRAIWDAAVAALEVNNGILRDALARDVTITRDVDGAI